MKDVSFKPTYFNPDEDIFSLVEDQRETVAFQLSDDEILAAGKEAAELNSQLKEAVGKFSQIKKDWSGKIKGLEAQMNYKFLIIADQAEDREVECTKRLLFKKGVAQFIYKGVVVKERVMSEWEKTSAQNVQASLNSASSSN